MQNMELNRKENEKLSDLEQVEIILDLTFENVAVYIYEVNVALTKRTMHFIKSFIQIIKVTRIFGFRGLCGCKLPIILPTDRQKTKFVRDLSVTFIKIDVFSKLKSLQRKTSPLPHLNRMIFVRPW